MKKSLSLLLTLILCLSLAACGKDTPTPETAPTVALYEPVETTQPDADQAMLERWLPLLCGEWKPLYREHTGLFDSLRFFEDGTAELDGRSYTWELNMVMEFSETERMLELFLCDGDQRIGNLDFQLFGQELTARMDSDSMGNMIALYKPAYYEVVTVTLDNWQEYLEFQVEEGFAENAFGEAERAFFRWSLQLKEPWNGRFSYTLMDDVFDRNVIDDCAMECSYDIGPRSVSVDLENRTVTLGDDFAPTRTETFQTKFSFDYRNATGYAGLPGDNIMDYEIQRGMVDDHYNNFQLTRIQMTLYLNPES